MIGGSIEGGQNDNCAVTLKMATVRWRAGLRGER